MGLRANKRALKRVSKLAKWLRDAIVEVESPSSCPRERYWEMRARCAINDAADLGILEQISGVHVWRAIIEAGGPIEHRSYYDRSLNPRTTYGHAVMHQFKRVCESENKNWSTTRTKEAPR